MCSLSWHHRKDGYEVFFNRDEKKTRGRALPPFTGEHKGVRYLSPKDSDAGGTWLLANEHGVTLALLNHWGTVSKKANPALSRGNLLSQHLANQSSASSAMEHLRNISLTGYGAFTLAAFDPTTSSAGPQVVRWNGERLASLTPEMPLCSSSFLPDTVIESRRRYFQTLPDQNPETLWDWHRREDSPTAYTVRMNRPDAQTWSISRVTVNRDTVSWRYIEEMPGLTAGPLEHQAFLKR